MDTLAFRLLLWLERGLFERELGAERSARLRRDAVEQLRAVLPSLPALGRPGARTFLVGTCYLVAIHRALPERPVQANADLVTRAVEGLFGRIPRPLRALRRWVFFQPWYYRPFLRSILGGPEGKGFTGEIVAEGPGRFGMDYHGCAIQTFLADIDARELGPYVCQLDFVESRAFGLGLVRTGTIALGAKQCDFRWYRDGAPRP